MLRGRFTKLTQILKGSKEGLTVFETTHLTRFNSQTWQRLPQPLVLG